MRKEKLQNTYENSKRHSIKSLLIEILLTCGIALVVIVTGWASIYEQAKQYSSDIKADYRSMINGYITTFRTMVLQLDAKIKEDPTYDEMNLWLQSMDDVYRTAIGSDVYDAISMTYKGSYARSWDYGDYSDYDPNTRLWYQQAQKADGEVDVVAPYVTYLDPSYLSNDEYILMTITQKYNEEISFDYDLKIMGIEKLLTGRDLMYPGTRLYLYDPEGYILSSNDENAFAHNINHADEIITEEFSRTLNTDSSMLDGLLIDRIDGRLQYLYLTQDEEGNTVCIVFPFMAALFHNFLPIILIALCLIFFEIYLYRHNRRTIQDLKARDKRLDAMVNATYEGRIYLDAEEYNFYGSELALKKAPSGTYEELYAYFKSLLVEDSEIPLFEEFLSRDALIRDYKEDARMETRRFTLNWITEESARATRTVEIGKLPYVQGGKKTYSLVFRDVTESAEQLKDALKQAKIASEAKGSFLSNMSHEIRTPLNAVIGYIAIAKDSKDDRNRIWHCLDNCEIASRHLLQIINDILDMSSIESGKLKIAYEEFDLKKQIADITAIFYQNSREKQITFETRVEDLTEEWVVGDQLRLNQILMNLLSNAVKFTAEKGRILLTIRQLRTDEKKVYVEFKVSDNGIGMSDAYMAKLFQPFEQESASTAKKYGGSGLGLSITHNLIQMMGGTIQVQSEQNVGTTFIVVMPFDRSEHHPTISLDATDYSRVRALVVDDERDEGAYVKAMLKRCGVKADTVVSGADALKRLKGRMSTDYAYNLCILDWNMPDMDGVEIATRIREEFGTSLPIIIATAYDVSEFEAAARSAGVNKIVSKPLFQSTLFDLLVATFGQYHPETERADQQPINMTGIHVLLAEDNAMNMEIAVTVLEKAGIRVDQATNGEEACNQFLHAPAGTYDLILMDVQMPVLDGYGATEKIRASKHEEAKTIPIIAMTANAFAEDVAEALSHGMNAHISKPVNYDKLFQVLQKFAKQSMNRREDE